MRDSPLLLYTHFAFLVVVQRTNILFVILRNLQMRNRHSQPNFLSQKKVYKILIYYVNKIEITFSTIRLARLQMKVKSCYMLYGQNQSTPSRKTKERLRVSGQVRFPDGVKESRSSCSGNLSVELFVPCPNTTFFIYSPYI